MSKWRIAKLLPFTLALLATIFAVGTYVAITSGNAPYASHSDRVMGLLLIDLVLLLALAIVSSRRVYKFWISRKKMTQGSRLQTRIVLMFTLVSAIPTIIVAVFAVSFFKFGIQSWFNDRVNTALQQSVAVAEAYVQEHKQVIRADALAVAHDLNRQAFVIRDNQAAMEQMVAVQSGLRKLPEVIVFQHGATNKIIARSPFSFLLAHELETISSDTMDVVNQGDVAIVANEEDRVLAMVRLDNYRNTYLLVGRFVDSKVTGFIENTQGAYRDYARLKSGIVDLQIRFMFIFVVVALLLLLASAWLGTIFASLLAKPISLLVEATEKVKDGDLSARIPDGPSNDELAVLGHAFNRMTEQLESQRHKLIETNQELDFKRRFNETVLLGVSAGVMALDEHKHITLANRSALQLLRVELSDLVGNPLDQAIPELTELLNKAEHDPQQMSHDQVSLLRGSKKMTLMVRITTELMAGGIEGYVVTFDDITELVSAQRSAAWADVARRIAHEIKNPLTPIQLAAERLKKKYATEVVDREMFERYTETITRHVSDIGSIVEEFVNFARMKPAKLAPADIQTIIKTISFSQECAHNQIRYALNIPKIASFVMCDETLISQVFTNVLLNAAESIEAKIQRHQLPENKGSISITLEHHEGTCRITCKDNGVGFPPDLIDRITEPYVTTRTKGTGLGLAIVKKIVEDHNGQLMLANHEEGAYVVIIIPLVQPPVSVPSNA